MYGCGEGVAFTIFFGFSGAVASADWFDGDKLFIDLGFCCYCFVAAIFGGEEFTVGGEVKASGYGC